MARCQAVARVKDQIARARKRQTHDPMGVLRKLGKTAAVKIEDDRERPSMGERSVDVENVIRAATLGVGNVADQFGTVARGLRARVKAGGSCEPVGAAANQQPATRATDRVTQAAEHAKWEHTRAAAGKGNSPC